MLMCDGMRIKGIFGDGVEDCLHNAKSIFCLSIPTEFTLGLF